MNNPKRNVEVRFQRYFRAKQAFTLVEVVVSIGVVVFALVAIFGLMTISLKNSKDANLRQGLTMTIDQMNSMYQGTNFAGAIAGLQTAKTNYFDNAGLPVATAANAYFQCYVTNLPPTVVGTTPMVMPANVTTNNMAVLQLQITWPAVKPNSTNISVFSIANYQ